MAPNVLTLLVVVSTLLVSTLGQGYLGSSLDLGVLPIYQIEQRSGNDQDTPKVQDNAMEIGEIPAPQPPQPRPQTEPTPRPQSQPRPQTRPQTEPSPRPQSQPRPKTRPQTEPSPRLQSQPRPQTRPQTEPSLRPQSQPRIESRPQSQPEQRQQPRTEVETQRPKRPIPSVLSSRSRPSRRQSEFPDEFPHRGFPFSHGHDFFPRPHWDQPHIDHFPF